MRERLKAIEEEAVGAIGSAKDPQELERLRIKYLGRKGILSDILKGMDSLAASERPEIGKVVNALKAKITSLFEEKLRSVSALARPRPEAELDDRGDLLHIRIARLQGRRGAGDRDRIL
jgi:phenylalanyl-tRNA synthetase alpha chain